MSAELIYKTISPPAIAWWKAGVEIHDIASAARAEYVKKVNSQFGPPPGEESRELMSRTGVHIVGLSCEYNEQPPVESGWRLDAKERIWMPKLATKQGQARAAELADLCSYDFRREAAAIGMAQMAFTDGRILHAGLDFDEHAGVLYQFWSSRGAAAESEAAQAKHLEVDWIEVPRSEWYAYQESKPAEEGDE